MKSALLGKRAICRTRLNLFKSRKKSIGIFHVKQNLEINSSFALILPEMPFTDTINVINRCSAIISPDTSVIHIGSALQIPVFGIFCGNNRDYWERYAMNEAWAPTSKNSKIFYKNTSKRLGNHNIIPISKYPPNEITLASETFLESLNL